MAHRIWRAAATLLLTLALLASLIPQPTRAQSGDDSGRHMDPNRVLSHIGILLLDVEEGSPAALAGLESGEIILAVNGVPVERVFNTLRIFYGMEPGDVLTFVVRSDDTIELVSVTVGTRGWGRPWLGVLPVPIFGQNATVGDLAVGEVRSNDAEPAASCARSVVPGWLIYQVLPGSPAEAAGLMPNDAILTIDGRAVTRDFGFSDAMRAYAPGDTMTLEVVRNVPGAAAPSDPRVVTVAVGENPEEAGRAYVGVRLSAVEVISSACEAMSEAPSETPLVAPRLESSAVVTPVVVDPMEPAPVEPAPVEPAPVEPAPVEPAPVEPAPVEAAPPVPTVDPPAGLETCVSDTTWGFGVTEVLPGGPADQAGLVANDAIIMIDGERIPENVQAESLLAAYAPGDTITLRVISTVPVGSDPGAFGDVEVQVQLGEHPSVPGRAYLGVMGMPVIMGESMSCSGSAPAQPVPDADVTPQSDEVRENGVKGDNVPKTHVDDAVSAPITGVVTITTTMVTTPALPTGEGLWLWCALEGGAYRCRYDAALDVPIYLEPADANLLPAAPVGISGGAIEAGAAITETEMVTPVEIAPLQETPLFYCWTGQGFAPCQPMTPEPEEVAP